MTRQAICICVLALVGALSASAQRLPEVAIPSHYSLKLQPNFVSDTFSGEEEIDVKVLKATTAITINAVDIAFQEVQITANGETQKAGVTTDKDREMATLTVANPIPAGPAKIAIRYSGNLKDKLRGFYLSKAEGRKYAVTQFEPTDARQAFPSFDEPAYKATFDVTVIAPRKDMVISNGRVLSDTAGPGTDEHTVKFATSPKMSTYLVAVLVGEFECQGGESDGVPVRVCTVPGKKPMGTFALRWAQDILHWYDNYYGIKYPFGKLDLIGIPDFEAGAMENTGTITFRDVDLLVAPNTSSIDSQKQVALVVAHEMAHQWFGDLVTMKWWNDIWLNEGFATWMETKPVAALKPEWGIDQDEENSAIAAMRTDSLQSTRAIRTNAESSAQINELFDSIAYNKTAAVLRMVESYLGPEVFRKGVNQYLSAHQYANATAEDFWTKLAQVANKPVDEIMQSYVTQPGLPMVAISEQCANGQATITQQRFLTEAGGNAKSASQVWNTPVCMSNPGDKPQCELIKNPQQTIKLPGCTMYANQNVGAHGYYRANFGADTVSRMAENFRALSATEQMWSLENEWALVRSGRKPVTAFMELAKAAGGSRSYGVWENANEHLRAISEDLVTDADRGAFRVFARELARPVIDELGWEMRPSDTYEQRSVRATAFRVLGYLGRDPQAIAEAQKMAVSYLKDPTAADPMLAGPALEIAAAEGGATFYDQVVAALKTAQDPEFFHRCLSTLTKFGDPALVTRTLKFALSPEVRSQDAPIVFAQSLANPAGRVTAWSFIQAHWPEVMQKSTVWGTAIVARSTANFCDAGIQSEIQQFFAQNPVPSARRGLQQSMEAINSCVGFKSVQQPKLAQWLANGALAGQN